MAQENEYEVKPVGKKAEDIEAIIDKKGLEEEKQPSLPQEPKEPQPRKGFQIPKIPTDKIFKTITNKDMMMETLHDETMEPHVHMVILLLLVFVLAIIIALIGI